MRASQKSHSAKDQRLVSANTSSRSVDLLWIWTERRAFQVGLEGKPKGTPYFQRSPSFDTCPHVDSGPESIFRMLPTKCHFSRGLKTKNKALRAQSQQLEPHGYARSVLSSTGCHDLQQETYGNLRNHGCFRDVFLIRPHKNINGSHLQQGFKFDKHKLAQFARIHTVGRPRGVIHLGLVRPQLPQLLPNQKWNRGFSSQFC